ncbi:uncharacterized protein LOC125877143 [Solanum stenotomum]|uniref:uncharacterized protein LOC125877143 n=1 Tax=Solanum stenotomum TaxID=172797 RepID=UPI0020D08B18|nr:uncharacterized protein LOC125877143 [Solanum stenotomum]
MRGMRTRRIMRLRVSPGMRTRRIMRMRVSPGMRTRRLVQRLIRLVRKLIKRLIQMMSNSRAGNKRSKRECIYRFIWQKHGEGASPVDMDEHDFTVVAELM